MNYVSVTNPRWQDAAHSRILCDVVFPHLGAEPLPFCADPTDVEAHGREIFDRAAAGEFGPIAAYVAPPSPAPAVPRSISRRQFFQQLAVEGTITEQEALDAMDGVIPAVLVGLIEQLPEADRFAARMHLKGSSEFLRGHPLTEAIGTAQGRSAVDIDAFYQAAEAL